MTKELVRSADPKSYQKLIRSTSFFVKYIVNHTFSIQIVALKIGSK